MGGACSTYGSDEKCMQGFVGKPEKWRPLGRLKYRWEDNIKLDFQEVGWENMNRMIYFSVQTGGGF
jgi:hypothetical protein